MKQKQSIASKCSAFTAGLVILQSLLVLGMLIAGGILKQARDTAYQSFASTVTLRASSIQDQIDNRWTNIHPYVQELSDQLSDAGYGEGRTDAEAFLTGSADTLISMLHVSGTTGTFLILNGPGQGKSLPALYFRDYDPETYSADNSDLFQVMGPAEVSRKYRIPLDSVWHYGLSLNDGNRKFFEMPYQAAGQSQDYKKLGYWSQPFCMTPEDVPVITYTVPLFDRSGQVHGVVGVEISLEYIRKLLPANELSAQDSPGYMIAAKQENPQELLPLVKKGEYQNRLFGNEPLLRIKAEDDKYSVCQVSNLTGEKIYGCIKSLDLYGTKNVPYDSGNWVVLGLMRGDALFGFLHRIIKIFAVTLMASLLLGAGAAGFISRKITDPVAKLAAKVRDFDYTRKIRLERTGIEELDLLSSAVEISNQNLLDNTLKMSEIMDLLGLPIGAFEYSPGGYGVQVTKQIFSLMELPHEDEDHLYVDEEVFLSRLRDMQKRPVPEENGIYRISGKTERWVRITLSLRHGHSLGIIEDVTGDMMKKQRMQYERDHDSLTRIYSRAAFQREAEAMLAQAGAMSGRAGEMSGRTGERTDHAGPGRLGTAAMVMLDLDGLKSVNDTHGHESGDIYIRETAVCMKQIPEEHAIVGRRSGDEFFMLLFGYENRDAVRKQLKDFYDILDNHPAVLPDGVQLEIHISSGIAWYGEELCTFEELVRCADIALYEAKENRKGRTVEYGTV